VALPKANRLRSRHDFNVVYQKGKRQRSPYLTLITLRQRTRSVLQAAPTPATIMQPPASQASDILPQRTEPLPAPSPTCLGVSISQKVSKRAVVRNRLKRQIQAAFWQLLPSFPTGWKLVVVVHPQAIQCDYFQFLRELEQLLIDAEVLDGHS